MILRRVPTSMLVALGLLPMDACKCPVGPCLELAPVEDAEVAPCLSEPPRDLEVHACLTPLPPADDDAGPPPQPPPEPSDDGALSPCLSLPEAPADDGALGPCLSPPEPPSAPEPAPGPKPDAPLEPCLSIAPPVRENGKGGGHGRPPADEPLASAEVVRRVLERGALPADVLERLRGRA